jgi:hypothetical protein
MQQLCFEHWLYPCVMMGYSLLVIRFWLLASCHAARNCQKPSLLTLKLNPVIVGERQCALPLVGEHTGLPLRIVSKTPQSQLHGATPAILIVQPCHLWFLAKS